MPNDDLISRNRVISLLKSLAYDKDMSDEATTAVCMVWCGIDRMPAVDAEPVRHGWWIRQDNTFTRYMCSECESKNHAGHENYCPNCGAKMDKEE